HAAPAAVFIDDRLYLGRPSGPRGHRVQRLDGPILVPGRAHAAPDSAVCRAHLGGLCPAGGRGCSYRTLDAPATLFFPRPARADPAPVLELAFVPSPGPVCLLSAQPVCAGLWLGDRGTASAGHAGPRAGHAAFYRTAAHRAAVDGPGWVVGLFLHRR